jgi:hypothetical protein
MVSRRWALGIFFQELPQARNRFVNPFGFQQHVQDLLGIRCGERFSVLIRSIGSVHALFCTMRKRKCGNDLDVAFPECHRGGIVSAHPMHAASRRG